MSNITSLKTKLQIAIMYKIIKCSIANRQIRFLQNRVMGCYLMDRSKAMNEQDMPHKRSFHSLPVIYRRGITDHEGRGALPVSYYGVLSA